MPPLPALRISALARLAQELKFVPPATARRHVERAEALVTTIDPTTTYPEDWVTFAITGYRPDVPDPAMLVGEALVSDLAPLIERLSAVAKYALDELPAAQWLSPEELCERWSISKKTLDRYRRRGLPTRRATTTRGRAAIAFARPLVEWFERRHAADLGRAAKFTRIDPADEERLVRHAIRYRRWLGWTLSRAAARLAKHTGRSHEAIRQLLKRHASDIEKAAPAPTSRAAGAITAHQRRVIERAVRTGVPITLIAKRLRKTAPSIHRAWALRRAEMLRGVDLRPHIDDPFTAAQTKSALAHEAAHSGLGLPAAHTLLEHLQQTLAAGWPDAAIELARARALHALRQRAAAIVAKLNRLHPRAAMIDAIQTDLLWTARLKAELIRSQQMLMLKSIEGRINRGLEDLPAALAIDLFRGCISALGEAADRFDPTKGGRLAAPAGLTLSRAIAKWAGDHASALAIAAPGKARAIATPNPGAVHLPDWTRAVYSWQTWLEPDSRLRETIPRLDQADQSLLIARYAYADLGGTRPHTIVELTTILNRPAHLVARREHAAMNQARRVWRAGAS